MIFMKWSNQRVAGVGVGGGLLEAPSAFCVQADASLLLIARFRGNWRFQAVTWW